MTQVQEQGRKPSAHRATVRARLRYRFDSAISQGTGRIILWLAVLTDLFDVEGSALSLMRSSWYTRGPVTFARVAAAARAWGEIAIGYRLEKGDGLPEVVLNPPKSSTVELDERAQVVVIAPV